MREPIDRKPERWTPLYRLYDVRCENRAMVPFYELDGAQLVAPLSWRKQREVTVTVDLWSRFVDELQAAAVFAVMASRPWSRFTLRTADLDKMRRWLAWIELGGESAVALYGARSRVCYPIPFNKVDPPTPQVRFLYDVGAPMVWAHLGPKNRDRHDLGQCHWRPWPLDNVVVLSE